MIQGIDPKTREQAHWERKARTNETIIISLKTLAATTLVAVTVAVIL